MSGSLTVDELVDRMVRDGNPITRVALRYHCRDPRGALYGVAYQFPGSRTWLIPVDAAQAFASSWAPYGTLRRKGRATGKPPPPAAPTVPDIPAKDGDPRAQ